MKSLTLSLFAVFFLIACEKDKDNDEISLKGKWNVENTIYNEYINGVLDYSETEPGGGTTIDFQNNGNVVINNPIWGVETYTYILRPDSKVEFDGDVYEIRNLTANSVTLYLREDYGNNNYDETSFNLKR
jgi:hypothetical protein